MKDVEIFNATPECIDGIMIVENLSFRIPWSRNSITDEITKNSFAKYICARIGNQIVGYAGMWIICGEGHITNIAVHPEFRRNGIGSRLLSKLVEIARENDVYAMTLEVRKSNLGAQELYKKHGFKPSGIRKAYYSDNGEDAIIMWKEIF
ncbi:MAG TPA: ribosomal protein S18-alanine N-acetyltransferase [Clostridiaceae bacterium]|nr:ribosomal protein S18-alanine N-acetyltransferase [Clostridiaceae bacterium]